ncbi:MAG: ribonuclease III [Magnetococcales bacterium]|nr:ribonuclease III [Magnetococcales bacterium]
MGYRFSDPALLRQALTHRSILPEMLEEQESAGEGRTLSQHNERLEFLGDAVLELVVSGLLFHRFPDAPEGVLSQLRSRLVNTRQLSIIGRAWEFGELLSMGRGELLSGGRTKESILGNALEAVLGAVFLDGGYEAAQKVAHTLLQDQLDQVRIDDSRKDFKSRLQERLQADGRPLPIYEVTAADGPAHERHFTVACHVDGQIMGCGEGQSKKRAEQHAAHLTLEALESQTLDTPDEQET